MDTATPRKLIWLLGALLFSSIFFIFFLSPVDNDLGWHLRYGEYFLEHGRPLMENTLSVLMAGYRWPNSYILYQPLVAFVYRHFSFWGGLSLFRKENSSNLVCFGGNCPGRLDRFPVRSARADYELFLSGPSPLCFKVY